MPTQTEIRSAITSRIIEALQSGVIPWRKPWRAIQDRVALPTNFTTLRPYGGINIFLLRLASLDQGYPVSFWASFNQWRSIGCNVRKGQHATQIVFYRPAKRTEEGIDGERVEKSFQALKTWAVFNVAQVEGRGSLARGQWPHNPNHPGVSDANSTATNVITCTTESRRRPIA